jgi:hypothetical protein
MIHRIAIFTTLCVFLLSGISCSIVEKTYQLSFSREKGKNIKYQYSFDVKRYQEADGSENQSHRTTKAVIDYTVNGIDEDGHLSITQKFDSLYIWGKSPTRGEYTTDTKERIGLPVHFTLDRSGNVLKTEGLEENTMSEWDMISIFFQLPDRKVKIGDSWTGVWVWEPFRSSGFRQNTFTTTYQVVEKVMHKDYDCLNIETNTKETIVGKSTYEGNPTESTGEAHLTGEIYFAYKEGIIVEKSYSEEAGKIHWKVFGPQPREGTLISFVNAKFSLVE